MIGRLIGLLVALRAAWQGWRRRDDVRAVAAEQRHEAAAADPSAREVGASPAAVRLVAVALFGCGGLGAAFAVLYALDPDTQLLGLAAGLALVALALALALAGLRVVPQETAVEERPELGDEPVRHELAEEVADGAEGVSRRGLLTAAAGAAGLGLAGAAAAPLASLGPRPGGRIGASPWRAGQRLVDEQGRPITIAMLEVGSSLTAFPEGADPRELGSPVVVLRVRPDELRLPPARAGWAPRGVMAYSRICTHAGCAVTLFRYPLNEDTSQAPALVCPCHYSTFDVRRACRVEFGPAGRPLPQLPLAIDPDGTLRAAGTLSGPVGPAWWGVGHA